MRIRELVLAFGVAAGLFGQTDNKAPVTLAGIEIEGSHLPAPSVIRLLGLQAGQRVDYDMLAAACDRLLSTGLVADATYSYVSKTDKTNVTVVFRIWDEEPLLPASVFPEANEPHVWSCLAGADPIFAKQLPNTKNALRFYVANINKCIADSSNQQLHAEAKVICDPNLKPSRIEFRIEPGLPD